MLVTLGRCQALSAMWGKKEDSSVESRRALIVGAHGVRHVVRDPAVLESRLCQRSTDGLTTKEGATA